MSGIVTSERAKLVAAWGAIVTTVFALATFLAVLFLAYAESDHQNITFLVGAAVSNATTAIGFWLGSSRGSQVKDEALLAGTPPQRPPLPPVP